MFVCMFICLYVFVTVMIHTNAVPTGKITLGTPFPGVPAGNDPWTRKCVSLLGGEEVKGAYPAPGEGTVPHPQKKVSILGLK